MAAELRIAVAGAGLIGRRHIAAIGRTPGVALAAVVDPAGFADAGVPVHRDLDALFSAGGIDGVILATPNAMHVPGARACIARGLPVLVEKPLSDDLPAARALVAEADRSAVPVLVGHHRRHNPLIAQAKALIEGGAIGTPRAAQVTCWLAKPDDYFTAAPWRGQPGAGPISVNMVHDVDVLRHLLGEVTEVRAQAAPSRRGHANEDMATALLRFASGALATLSVSDAIAAPWSWEMTARENPAYAATDQSCCLIGGSEGSLSLPDLRLWRHEGAPDWFTAIGALQHPRPQADPLEAQIAHFAEVIRGAPPLVSGAEGLATLEVVEAIAVAARTGQTVTPGLHARDAA